MPFKIYANFECNAKRVKTINRRVNTSYTKKYQADILCSFAYKVVCVDNKLRKSVVLFRRKNSVYRFIKTIFKEYNYCRGMIENISIRIQ